MKKRMLALVLMMAMLLTLFPQGALAEGELTADTADILFGDIGQVQVSKEVTVTNNTAFSMDLTVATSTDFTVTPATGKVDPGLSAKFTLTTKTGLGKCLHAENLVINGTTTLGIPCSVTIPVKFTVSDNYHDGDIKYGIEYIEWTGERTSTPQGKPVRVIKDGTYTLTSGWYVVPKDTTVSNYGMKLAESAIVHIILADGCVLDSNITLGGTTATLNIYAQSDAKNKGKFYGYIQCRKLNICGGYLDNLYYGNPLITADTVNFYGGTVMTKGNSSGNPVKAINANSAYLQEKYSAPANRQVTVKEQLNGEETRWNETSPLNGSDPVYPYVRINPLYKIIFNGEGSIVDDYAQNYEPGVGKALPMAAEITRNGATFDGWYGNAQYTGEKILNISDEATGEKTFYAKWILEKYKVTYDSNGGSAVTDGDTEYNVETTSFKLPTPPTWKEHKFGGWRVIVPATDSNKGFEEGDLYSGTTVTLDKAYGNVTLTAQWKPYKEFEFLGEKTFTWNGSGDVLLHIDEASPDGFLYVTVGNQKRTRLDTDDIGLELGSTKLTLKNKFLSKLPNGTYDIHVEFENGYVDTELTVARQGAPVHQPETLATSYTVGAFAGEGGKISPEGSRAVPTGSDVTFTITPDAGYVVKLVLLDSANVTGNLTDGKFTISNVMSDYTLRVTFEKAEAAPLPADVTPAAPPQTGDRATGIGFAMLALAVLTAVAALADRRRARNR